jgi:hypothetical protein
MIDRLGAFARLSARRSSASREQRACRGERRRQDVASVHGILRCFSVPVDPGAALATIILWRTSFCRIRVRITAMMTDVSAIAAY